MLRRALSLRRFDRELPTMHDRLRTGLRRLLPLSSAVLLLACITTPAALRAQHGPLPRTTPYPEKTIEAFERLPVQEGGRIKPLLTYARFLLLRLNERSSMTVPDESRYGELAGERLGPVAWALDVMLFPDQADTYPCFLVTDRDLFDRIGLRGVAKRKRDRYSFHELQPGLQQIARAAGPLRNLDANELDRLEGQIVSLYHDLFSYLGLRSVLTAVRTELPVEGSALLQEVFGEDAGDGVRFAQALRRGNGLDAVLRRIRDLGDGERSEALETESRRVQHFMDVLSDVAKNSRSLTWLPPADQREEAWLDPYDVFLEIRQQGVERHRSQVQALALLQDVVDGAETVRRHGEHAPLATASVAFVDHVRGMSEARGEGEHVETEVGYYRANWLFKAWLFFLIGTVIAPFSWIFLRRKLPMRLTWLCAGAGLVMLTIGITYRCIIRERPPVSTLYETFLLVTGSGVLVAMVAEFLVRRRIALPLAVVTGTAGLWLAELYEFTKGEDTMPQLQAVLDTNFYLSIHVTTVTLGYMASLLAGTLGAVYLIGRLFSDNGPFFRAVGRIVYGVLCFGLLLSTFGTIMGGVWANDSWGRFWGWDPKENGALMIVLWQLLILHGRMGGYWKNWGMSMLAVIGNMIVAFSWFHVNLMGVGLHSYGFSAGLKTAVFSYYSSQLLVLAFGGIAWMLIRQRAALSHQLAEGATAEP